MRRQTAQFWAYLSILVVITLLLAGASYAVDISQVTEFTNVSTHADQDSKLPVQTVEDPAADHQAAVQAANYREKQGAWYDIATLTDAQAKHLAQLEAQRLARKSHPQVNVESSPSRPSTSGVEQWRSLVASYSDWNVDLMLNIMKCESGGNPNDKNRHSSASGLFQILGGPFDPAANVALAHTMWASRGSQPWTASASCW